MMKGKGAVDKVFPEIGKRGMKAYRQRFFFNGNKNDRRKRVQKEDGLQVAEKACTGLPQLISEVKVEVLVEHACWGWETNQKKKRLCLKCLKVATYTISDKYSLIMSYFK